MGSSPALFFPSPHILLGNSTKFSVLRSIPAVLRHFAQLFRGKLFSIILLSTGSGSIYGGADMAQVRPIIGPLSCFTESS